MYAVVLFAHSWIRWLVLVVGLLTLGRSVGALVSGRGWTRADRLTSVSFVGLIDLQALLGLMLYLVLSPVVPKSMAEFKAAMHVAPLRFFAVEHITAMLIVLGIAHFISVRSRRATEAKLKHRYWVWGIGAMLLLLLIAIPWPWSSAPRPLLRLL